MNNSEKVVITGLGVVSPIGIGIEAYRNGLLQQKSGVQVRKEFDGYDWPLKLFAPVDDFDGKQWVRPRKALKVMCMPIQFGYTAATMAIEQAGIGESGLNPDRLGTVFGSETFFADPMEVAEVFRKCVSQQNYQHDRWGEFAMRDIQPLWMLKYLPNMVTSHISIAADARGPSNSICQGAVSGLLALIEGVQLVQRGTCDAVVVGGAGSQTTLSGMLYRGQHQISKKVDDPENAIRPFDAERDGTVFGEGAGAMILESESFALSRGANILASVEGFSRGYCQSESNQFSATLCDLMRLAVERSALSVNEFAHVNAHGCADMKHDIDEAIAINSLFNQTPVTAYKSNFGHLGPGGAIVELIASILSTAESRIYPGRNFETADDRCPINVCTRTRDTDKNAFIKVAFSATGQIANVAIRCTS